MLGYFINQGLLRVGDDHLAWVGEVMNHKVMNFGQKMRGFTYSQRARGMFNGNPQIPKKRTSSCHRCQGVGFGATMLQIVLTEAVLFRIFKTDGFYGVAKHQAVVQSRFV